MFWSFVLLTLAPYFSPSVCPFFPLCSLPIFPPRSPYPPTYSHIPSKPTTLPLPLCPIYPLPTIIAYHYPLTPPLPFTPTSLDLVNGLEQSVLFYHEVHRVYMYRDIPMSHQLNVSELFTTALSLTVLLAHSHVILHKRANNKHLW